MKKYHLVCTLVTILVIMIACTFTSSRTQDASNPNLIDQMVTVPGGGGNVEVSFKASNGQRIQILLSASNASLQPYGSLQYPDGTSVYNPPINTAVNGVNQVELPIDQTGQYTLTLFDSSNQGGAVSVKIIVLK